jgi:hypothetical protein
MLNHYISESYIMWKLIPSILEQRTNIPLGVLGIGISCGNRVELGWSKGRDFRSPAPSWNNFPTHRSCIYCF